MAANGAIMSESKNLSVFSAGDFSTSDLYAEILSRKKKIPELKSQIAMLESQMRQMCHNLMYSDGTCFTEQEMRSIKERTDELKKEVIVLDGIALQSNISGRTKSKAISYKECFMMFVDQADGTFTPSSVLDYVSDKRGVEPSNSVRVYVHRMLKDMLFEGVIVQLNHGKYRKAEKGKNQ